VRSAVTFTRDNNLFLVPLDSGELTQLTDVQPKKRDPRETDSQKFVKAEEQKLLDHTRIEAEKKKKAEEKDKAHALPKLELADRQTANDLQLSPTARTSSSSSSSARRRPSGPTCRTTSPSRATPRTSRPHLRRRRAGPAPLSVMNLDRQGRGRVRPRHSRSQTRRQGHRGHKGARVRWGMPQLSDDGSHAVAQVRVDDNKDRWLLAVDPESGKARASTRCTTMRGSGTCAAMVRKIRRSDGCRIRSACGSSRNATAGCICTPSTQPRRRRPRVS
jgi:hypothetical protein